MKQNPKINSNTKLATQVAISLVTMDIVNYALEKYSLEAVQLWINTPNREFPCPFHNRLAMYKSGMIGQVFQQTLKFYTKIEYTNLLAELKTKVTYSRQTNRFLLQKVASNPIPHASYNLNYILGVFAGVVIYEICDQLDRDSLVYAVHDVFEGSVSPSEIALLKSLADILYTLAIEGYFGYQELEFLINAEDISPTVRTSFIGMISHVADAKYGRENVFIATSKQTSLEKIIVQSIYHLVKMALVVDHRNPDHNVVSQYFHIYGLQKQTELGIDGFIWMYTLMSQFSEHFAQLLKKEEIMMLPDRKIIMGYLK